MPWNKDERKNIDEQQSPKALCWTRCCCSWAPDSERTRLSPSSFSMIPIETRWSMSSSVLNREVPSSALPSSPSQLCCGYSVPGRGATHVWDKTFHIIFGRLILGGIDEYLCNWVLMLQHVSRDLQDVHTFVTIDAITKLNTRGDLKLTFSPLSFFYGLEGEYFLSIYRVSRSRAYPVRNASASGHSTALPDGRCSDAGKDWIE